MADVTNIAWCDHTFNTMTPDEPRPAGVLTSGQVAAATGLSVHVARRLIDSGAIRGYRLGVHRRVTVAELLRFLESSGMGLGLWGAPDALRALADSIAERNLADRV